MIAQKIQNNIFNKKGGANPLFLPKNFKLKKAHFFSLSSIFHVSFLIPLFFELFIQTERISKIHNYPPVIFTEIILEKENNKSKKTTSKNQEILSNINNKQQIHVNKKQENKLAKNNEKKILKDYEDHITNKVAFVLEEHVDDYKIEGNFLIQFGIKNDGTISNINIKSNNKAYIAQLKELMQKIHKFNPMSNKISEQKVYYFSLPLEIDQK